MSLELGTGVGAVLDTGWITWGLLLRGDVVTIIEKEPQTAAVADRGAWPQFVDLRVGDALAVLDGAGAFALIFADARAGNRVGLRRGRRCRRLACGYPPRQMISLVLNVRSAGTQLAARSQAQDGQAVLARTP